MTKEAESNGPKVSEALRQDLRAVRRGARQHAALEQPDLLVALLAFHLSSMVGRGFAMQRFNVSVRPTTGDDGYRADARLLDTNMSRSSAADVPRAFKAFRKRGAEHIRDVLTLELARLLEITFEDFGKFFDKEAAVNVRSVWTPTADNFFKRVTADYLDALWCEIVGVDLDSGEARAFAKGKKAEKAARLETLFNPATELPADQRVRADTWLPPEMF